MKVTLPHEVLLRNVSALEEGDGLSQRDIDMQAADRAMEMVTVTSQATDGYWDITFQDGNELNALSWYHLEGFTQDTTAQELKEVVLYFGNVPDNLSGKELCEYLKKEIDNCNIVQLGLGQYLKPQ